MTITSEASTAEHIPCTITLCVGEQHCNACGEVWPCRAAEKAEAAA